MTLRLVPALTLLAFAAACSDQPIQGTIAYKSDGAGGPDGGGVSDGHSDALPSDGTNTSDSATLPDGARDPNLGVLVFATKKDDNSALCEVPLCALKMTQNTQRPLQVQYVRAGKPVQDVQVQFAPKEGVAALGQVLLENVITDEKGIALSEVKAGQDLGVWSVLARVPGEPQAGELEFQLSVASKAKGPLQVTLHYVGGKAPDEFGELKARLSKQVAGEPACKGIDLGAETLPQAAWVSPNLKWDKPWTISYPNFATSLPQTGDPVAFTVVGVAWPAGKSSLTSKAVAGGCVDTGATVWWDPKTKTVQGESVTVDVFDLPPRLQGTYDLTTYLNLISVLPDNVEVVVTAILDIVKKPVAGIFALACKLSKGSLDSLCANIFDDPKNPNVDQLATPFGGIIVEFLNAILLGLLPQNVQTGLNTGADIAAILTKLEVGGTIQIMAEPDGSGYVPKDKAKQTWTTVTYKWSLGQGCNPKDPACGKKTFNIEAFQSNTIAGNFELWRDKLKWEVKIGLHALDVKWGALVVFLIEKQVLPALTFDPKNPGGPVVDSFEKLIKSIIAGKPCLTKDTCCMDFGKQLAQKQSLLKADFLAGACETVITLGVGFLKAQLAGLETKSGDLNAGKGLLLAADHCPIFDTDDDLQIDMIGSPNLQKPQDQCQWDMTLTIGGGKPEKIKATFFAVRQQ
jgi:hypothetical protein